jgi:hypothetical protein
MLKNRSTVVRTAQYHSHLFVEVPYIFPCVQVSEEAVSASFPSAVFHRQAGVCTLELHIAAFQEAGVGTRKMGGAGETTAASGTNKKSSQLKSSAKAEFNKHHTRVCGVLIPCPRIEHREMTENMLSIRNLVITVFIYQAPALAHLPVIHNEGQ